MAARKQGASTEYVVYQFQPHGREIDAAAWRNVGVEDQTKVVWNADNEWAVPVADLSEAALGYLATEPTEFSRVTYEE